MSGVLILAAYGALVWQAGPWGLAAITVHIGLMLVAVRLRGAREGR